MEHLILGSNADSVTGSAGSEWVLGSGGNDTINGLGGSDELGGGDGADRIDCGDGDDFAADGTGADSLVGGLGNDVLFGTIDGSVDTLLGGAGNDAVDYRFNAAAMNITLSAVGTGTVTSGTEVDTFSQMEIYRLGTGNDTFVGSSGDDTVQGHTGNANLTGGDGNDTFIVGYGDGTDTIAGGLGTADTIAARSASTYIYMANVTGVEVFNGGAWANFRLLGSTAGDTIDLSGAKLTNVERIDGGAGTADTIRAVGPGVKVDWTRVSNVEFVDAAGFSNVQLVGTDSGDTLNFTGIGLTGIYLLDGGLGNDTITGSAAADRIIGRNGADVITGAAGSDIFYYTSFLQSTTATADTIMDFTAGDKFDFLTMDGNTGVLGLQAFHWVGAAAFSAAGQLRAFSDGLGHTIIEGNVNSDLAADFKIILDNGYAIGSGDFLGITI